jgi:cytochrome c
MALRHAWHFGAAQQRYAAVLAVLTMLAPAARADGPADLFAAQCGTCHTMSAKDPMLQGPNLGDVYGRKVGSVAGFAYSPDYLKANFVWDTPHLDAYLANPAAVLPDSYMAYQQPDAAIRAEIIAYLKQQAPLYRGGK